MLLNISFSLQVADVSTYLRSGFADSFYLVAGQLYPFDFWRHLGKSDDTRQVWIASFGQFSAGLNRSDGQIKVDFHRLPTAILGSI